MGVHLGHGAVVGDRLQCPLHRWEWGDGGRGRLPDTERPLDDIRHACYPVEERFGQVFLFNGDDVSHPLPRFEADPWVALAFHCGRPVTLRCPWLAVAANGFDMHHLRNVHGRALRREPVVERPDRHRVRLRYVSRVTGRTAADRAIKWLSGDSISVTVTCHGGTIISVESDLGSVRSVLLLCLRDLGPSVEVVPIFGGRGRGRWSSSLKALLARWLYGSFIRKDVAFMDDMRFRYPAGGPEDPVLHRFLEYAAELPTEESQGGAGSAPPAALTAPEEDRDPPRTAPAPSRPHEGRAKLS
jgi:phenylpropionate dioxygenase-like ring-hydroxylating dioxygenase large terminal subunit